MKTLLFGFAVLSIMLGSPLAVSQSSCVEEQTADAAMRAVRYGSKTDFPLGATLVPSLSDDVIFLKTRGALDPHMEVPLVNFYRVTPSQYKLSGNRVESETVEVDNYSEWLVAIDRQNDLKFLLEGSADPVAEFNKLARDLHLKVADADAALGVFDFFLKVARGQQFRSQVVGDEMKLESVALEDFRFRFPTTKRRAAFNSWWGGVPLSTRKALAPPKAILVKNGFEIQYFLYSQGSISSQSLTVNADGTVLEGRSQTITRRSAR